MSLPKGQWWIRLSESDKVLEEVLRLEEVALELGPVAWSRRVQVLRQFSGSGSSNARLCGQKLRSCPRGSECVVPHKGQAASRPGRCCTMKNRWPLAGKFS